MAGPFQTNFGDMSGFDGLPMPASPVTSSGQDPDEVRELLAQHAAAMGRQMGGDMAAANPIAPAAKGPQLVPSTTPAGPASTPASNVEPAGFNADVARRSMTGQLNAGQRMMETAEDENVDPAIAELRAKKLQDEGAAPNPKDPNYKAGFGTRLLRGLRGVGMGLAQGGVFGALAGGIDPGLTAGGKNYGAPTDAYDIAAAKNRRQVGQDEAGLQSALDNFKLAQDTRKQREAGFKDSSEALSKAGTTATTQESEEEKTARLPIDEKKANTEAQVAFNASPEGKLQVKQGELDQRTKQADKLNMPPGYMRTRYLLTGDIQAAREPTSEEIAVNKILSSWPAEHPGQKAPSTVAQWQQVYAAAKGGVGSAGGDMGKGLREAASLAEKNLKNLQTQKTAKTYMLLDDDEKKKLDDDIEEARQNYATLSAQLVSGPPAAGAPAVPGAPAAPVVPAVPQAPAQAGGDAMVRMKLPDGRFARIPKANVEHAKKLGAVEAAGK